LFIMTQLTRFFVGAAASFALLAGAGVTASAMLGGNDASAKAPHLAAADVLDLPEMGAEVTGGDGAQAAEAMPAALVTAQEAAETAAPAADNGRLVIKRILPIDGPIKYGEWHWDEAGVPDGPLVMTVDLEARVLSVFRGGYEIGAAAVLLGTQDHPTPLGVFPILTKERHNVSEKYNNAPMPWTLRLTWDGIAIHGGSEVENGYASHGCIGVPDELAARLFAIARKGDKVIITRGKQAGIGTPLV
jgi:lipoprotein-anchoring transpeptidase ErfK/SrfK